MVGTSINLDRELIDVNWIYRKEMIMAIEKFFRPDLSELRPYSVKHHPYKIKLDANENPLNISKPLRELISQKILDFEFNRYPDAEAKNLRNKLAKWLNVPVEWICVGNGSDELISYIMTAFAREDARVLYPTPTFAMYEILAHAAGIETVDVSLTDDFQMDLPQFFDSLNSNGTNLIFISYPNNPTGNCFDENAIRELINQPNTLVIIDEAYHEFSGKTFLSFIVSSLVEENEESSPNLIVTRTFSKAYGLASLRIGYMIAHPKIIREINKIRLPYNLNSFSQFVAYTVLENLDFLKPVIDKIITERDRIYKKLLDIEKVYPFPTDANFILMRFSDDADKIFEKLLSDGILIRNLNRPGKLKNCLRVCVGTPEENDIFLKCLSNSVQFEQVSRN